KGADRRFRSAVNTERRTPFDRHHGGVQHDASTIPQQWQRTLDAEQQAAYIDVELLVKVLLGNLPERRELSDAGIREQNIQRAFLLLHDCIQPLDIREFRDIALNA